MGKRIDLTGQRFGMLVVESFAYMSKDRHTVWNCRCDCGGTTVSDSHNLKRGHTTSCGCKLKNRINLVSVGERFDRLVVQSHIGPDQYGSIHWRCICDCGNVTDVKNYDLTSGHTRSCGCLRPDATSASITTHGLSYSRLYRVWSGMIARCTIPSCTGYNNYGGRGITICDEWKSDFLSFYKWAISHGYQKGLTIDRKDVNGDYCPENCRWATKKQQANNKRGTTYIVYNGLSMTISEASEQYGIPRDVLSRRIRDGWSDENAIELPLHKHRSK